MLNFDLINRDLNEKVVGHTIGHVAFTPDSEGADFF